MEIGDTLSYDGYKRTIIKFEDSEKYGPITVLKREDGIVYRIPSFEAESMFKFKEAAQKPSNSKRKKKYIELCKKENMDQVAEESLLRRLWKENPIIIKNAVSNTSKETLMSETSLARHILEDLEVNFIDAEEIIEGVEDLKPAAFDAKRKFDIKMSAIRLLREELHFKLKNIESIIREMETESHSLIEKKKRCETEIEILLKKAEVVRTLENCRFNCEHRNALRILTEDYNQKARKVIVSEDFHFLICHDPQHLGMDVKSIIQAHQEVINEWGFSWWGKSIGERGEDVEYYQVKLFGESLTSIHDSPIAKNIQEKVRKSAKNGHCQYLYLFIPNPSNTQLYVCKVLDFWFGEGEIPHGNEFNQPNPQCAYFPRYYFKKREKMCRTCTKVESSRCTLNHFSNFWFKIDEIREIQNIGLEFANLQDYLTKMSIDFSRPILYPLLVTQIIRMPHF